MINHDQKQIDFWKTESWNYLQRNYGGRDFKDLCLHPYLDRLLKAYPISIEGGSILEIGCGAANNCYQLKKLLKANRGVGTEPSPECIEALSNVYPELEFYESDSRTLPFNNAEFDLVVLRSVLHWVDRDYILQTIGEAIRVAARYLIISDFAPKHPYCVIYHHRPQYRTFKIGYQPLVESTGFMRCLASIYSNDGDEWNGIQTALFEKMPLEDAFPLRKREDFEARGDL